jgi:predicted polyphosphate/ATP-dependent NAD kinase
MSQSLLAISKHLFRAHFVDCCDFGLWRTDVRNPLASVRRIGPNAVMRIGLIVNPIAGLGGSVGLKGTDGPDTVAEALRRGGQPRAGLRARAAFDRLAVRMPGAAIITVPGQMGADWLEGLDLSVEEVALGPLTGTARDTRSAFAAMAPLDLVVFAGGDGTARDIADALAPGVAMLGIPCGVKMHSGVFAVTPGAAGALLAQLMAEPDSVAWDDTAEVMDIDEDALRAGTLAPRLFGLARVPVSRSRMQAAKGGPRQDAGLALALAAAGIAAGMAAETLYLIGPGTSAGAVLQAMGLGATVLGTDAVLNGTLVASDARADQLEDLAKGRQVRIILGVTGQQGFLLGRGNQQISPALIAAAGRDGLIVLATEAKLAALSQPKLWVDTGDAALDAALAGFIRVHTGAGRQMMMRVGAADP